VSNGTSSSGISANYVIVAILIAAAFAGGLFVGRIGSSSAKSPVVEDQYHYEHLKRGDFTQLVRIHKATGKTEILHTPGGWQEPKPVKEWVPPPAVAPVEMAAADLAKLQAKVGRNALGQPAMFLYNGSQATVHDVVLHLRARGKSDAVLADLNYSFNNPEGTKPLTSSQQTFKLDIVNVYQLKEIEVIKIVRATAIY
jgi:hypothetical protein